MKLSRPTLKVRFPKIRKLTVLKTIIFLAVIGFIASATSVWLHERNKAENIFWGMVSNSLQTRSLIRNAPRDTSLNQPEQTMYFVTSPQQAVHGVNKYFQSGDNLEPTLVTEVIGTGQSDYVRVRQLNQQQPGQKQPDTSSFKDVWANTGGTTDSGGQLFNQAALNVVPIGYLNHDQRVAFIAKLQDGKAYKILPTTVKRVRHNGRPAYQMEVLLNTEQYVRSFKEFADMTGLKGLEGLDPEDYKGAKPIDMVLTIDIISKQLLIIDQPTSSQLTMYTSHGIVQPKVVLPSKTIPIQELQMRIQSAN